MANDVRMRKAEQELTLRQLPDVGGAFSFIGHRQSDDDGPSLRLAGEQKLSATAEENLLDLIRVSQPRSDGFACFQVPDPSGRITGTRRHQGAVGAEREVENWTAMKPDVRGFR